MKARGRCPTLERISSDSRRPFSHPHEEIYEQRSIGNRHSNERQQTSVQRKCRKTDNAERAATTFLRIRFYNASFVRDRLKIFRQALLAGFAVPLSGCAGGLSAGADEEATDEVRSKMQSIYGRR
jgi:hypothetical protein